MSKTYSAGIVTAYGAAKRAGYQGTYEEFCRQQAGYAGNAAAVEAAKTAAQTAASTATAKAGEATTATTAAQTAETNAERWAELAQQAATDNGYAQMYIDDDGTLYLTRTTNIVDKLDFNLTNDGELEVLIYG